MSSVIKQSRINDKSSSKLIELRPLFTKQAQQQEQQIEYEINPRELLEEAQREVMLLKKNIQSEYEEHQQRMITEREDLMSQMTVEKEAAIQAGYQEGYQIGKDDALKAYTENIQQAKQVLTLAKKEYNAYINSAEMDILTIAMEVAKGIINDTLQQDHKKWLSLVKKAIQETRDQDDITITVDPGWLETMITNKKELENMAYGSKVYIYPDEKLPLDSCLIETPYGQINASIDSQLYEMKSKLTEILEQGLGRHEGN